ncbi:hypothetical protein XBO1_2530008 [Xenorhabdus bovienii str. oregonense]|uniref:Uncharacterized protein n=1 Tax=Xenorhabdus bovienii str. oregonense TaxID=1398202 RepID=A0A077P876_XENBV|nr:hypothetical protein XBO1_2530008 [Xenorhabdus bovienii str. oregonense]
MSVIKNRMVAVMLIINIILMELYIIFSYIGLLYGIEMIVIICIKKLNTTKSISLKLSILNIFIMNNTIINRINI